MLAALLFGCLLLNGCQTRFPSEQIPKMKLLVMPFGQPPTMRDNPTLVRGWWFSSRTIRQNPRAGAMLAETLTRQLAQMDYLNLYSNIDLKYYFADKRKALKDQYGQLKDEEIDRLLESVPATEYARELGADKVLTGQIQSHYMGENNAVHWWWSTLQAEVRVIDVATKRIEWQKTYKIRQQLASQYSVQEELSRRITRDLEKEYFGPMARK
jgi:hypothetical protein